MREAIGRGETIVEAQENACKELGIEVDEASFEVIQLPEKKKLGLFGGREAKVFARVQETPSKYILEYLDTIIGKISSKEIKIDITEKESCTVCNINGEGVKEIIGRNGEILDSLQILSGLAASQKSNSYYRVMINAEGFNEKRNAFAKKEVTAATNLLKKNGTNVHLKPMNSYERRIVHELVQEIEGIESWSENEGNKRHVVIGKSKNAADYTEKDYHKN